MFNIYMFKKYLKYLVSGLDIDIKKIIYIYICLKNIKNIKQNI